MISEAVIGVDEVGRGCLAGPMVIGAFYAPSERWDVVGLDDSKKMSPKARSSMAAYLTKAYPNNFELVWVPADVIDRDGITRAHRDACITAVNRLCNRIDYPERVIMDGTVEVIPCADHIAKADTKYPSVMAAAVIAKVARDTWMIESADKDHPQYGFRKHVGYGTAEHLQALNQFGACALHRTTFKPVAVAIHMQRVRMSY